MANYDLLQLLSAAGKLPQQDMMSSMGLTSPYLQSGYGNIMTGQQSTQQNQQPSWLDALNHTMMLGNMMPQQQQFGMGQYGMGMGGYGQQQMEPQNWWQKGLTGSGQFLQGISSPLTTAGTAGLSMGLPHAGLAAGGGIAAGGLGNLLQYLGQPGVRQ